MSSYRWRVKEELIRILRGEIQFTPEGEDTCDEIPPENIVFRKVSVKDRDINENKTLEQFPAIVVSCPFDEPFSETAGEIAHDEYTYRFLIQILDRDFGDQEANLESYWAWQEKILRKLTWNCLCNIDAPYVISTTNSVDNVDEQYWLKYQTFKCGVIFSVKVWMTRTSDCPDC